MTGAVLWSFSWLTPPEMNNVCQPVPLAAADSSRVGRVFISSGYGKGCAVLDVSRDEEGFRVWPEWSNSRLKAKFSSVVVSADFVYGLDDNTLACLDLRTGERRWKGGWPISRGGVAQQSGRKISYPAPADDAILTVHEVLPAGRLRVNDSHGQCHADSGGHRAGRPAGGGKTAAARVRRAPPARGA